MYRYTHPVQSLPSSLSSPPPPQYTTMGKSLPKVELRADMCAVCGQRIEPPSEDGREAERTYRLTCGHLYPPHTYTHTVKHSAFT